MRNTYKIALILFVVLTTSLSLSAQTKSSDVVFQIEVATDQVNSEISLNWNTLPNVTGYKIYRKVKGTSGFTFITNKTALDTTYIDNTIAQGLSYEYAVHASHTNQISGYVCSGINIPVKHHQGNVLLVIDSTYIIPAQSEIELFKRDLIKDGWKVLVQYAGRNESPIAVKQKISNCNSSTSLEGVILLGHIPVPYSGNIAPDAHADHIGAWPADVYYGDMCSTVNSVWQDASLVNTSASSVRNHNIIGDGKYDVSSVGYSTSPKIFVGRIDVYNMTAINSNDIFLFKQYINKNHKYKASIKKFKKQGLIDDNFGYFYGEAFAQNGWRNMSALLGRDSITEGNYMTDLKTDTYLWSYACGGGWNAGASGVGHTSNFNSSQLESVFTMLYGSYFGDWDTKNNFLRAPIASPSSTLVSFWAGRPNWFVHNMALGDPIGSSFTNTVDNVGEYSPKGSAYAQVHQSLQGDPTLRMYMYEAPTNLEAFQINNGTQVKLEWFASLSPNVVGYYIYRSTSINGDFQLLNQTPVTTLSYTDINPLSTSSPATYMVRAVKLEQTVTGSFYNLSPGEIVEAFSANAPLPVTVTDFSGIINNDHTNTLFWDVAKEDNILKYELERSNDAENYKTIAVIEAQADAAGEWSYNYDDLNPTIDNYYRLKIIDVDGGNLYHSKIIRLKQREETNKKAVLFPNPATNEINLKLPHNDQDHLATDVFIYDMNGRLLLNQHIMPNGTNAIIHIDIKDLAIGHYIVMYKQEESFELNSIKFVKRL